MAAPQHLELQAKAVNDAILFIAVIMFIVALSFLFYFSLNNVCVQGSSITLLREQVSAFPASESVGRASRLQALDPQTLDLHSRE